MKKSLLIFAYTFLGFLGGAVLVTSIAGLPSGIVQDVDRILLPANSNHWFGTDSLGRDLFARVILGGRVSLFVGVVCSLLSFVIGFFVGVISGWQEGFVDKVFMRVCDILMAIPSFILVSVLCLGTQVLISVEDPYFKSLISLCVGISLTHWMSLARVTRGMVLEVKRKPFVEAAVALGGSQSHIVIRHILPNVAGTLIILVALQIPSNIMYESFMSFVGLGVQPPYTSWGMLVKEGWKTLSSFPHLILFPSLVLFLTVWSFHLVLEHLRTRLKI